MPRSDLTTKSISQTLGFNQVRHEVATIDSQPTATGGVIVIAVGALIVREGRSTTSFDQTAFSMKS